MSGRDDGGPAFAVNEHFDERRGEVTQYANAGMTLRDHFAGEALKGMWSNAEVIKALSEVAGASETVLSKMAYAQAEAMLKERAR